MLRLRRLLAIATLTLTGCVLSFAASQTQAPASAKATADAETHGAAYQNGYQDGWIDGEAAWAHSQGANLNSSGSYKKADHGYTESLGDKNEYKESYRRGFVEGYSVGYGIAVREKSHK